MSDKQKKLEIVAELAQGFEGNPQQARLLLKAAAVAGATSAKYQLVYAAELATPDYKYYDLFKSLEMPDDVWMDLARLAAAQNLSLDLDIFGPRSLKLAVKIGVRTVKIHGTDIANIGFLELVSKSSVPRVMLGTGGATAKEIEQALNVLTGKNIILLLGFQGYPTPNETNQIARISFVRDHYASINSSVSVGFADHAAPDNPLRYALAAAAVAAGATVIEKHLTLGRIMQLEDYESALNPDEFSEFCATIRSAFEALGVVANRDDFGMSDAEYRYREMIRRHVIAKHDLVEGTVISPTDVELKRTSTAAPITDIGSVYGKTISKIVPAGTPILLGNIKP